MMLFAKPFAIATCMFLFAMAGFPETGLPVELRQITDRNREITFPPLYPDLEDIINSFVKLNLDMNEHVRIFEILRRTRILHMERHGNPSSLMYAFGTVDLDALLTHEQIVGEIRFLFDLLRHGYDGYLYFGGDTVFLPIRDAMLKQLSGMANPLPVSSYLNDLIKPALRGVIADNHFRIHNVTFSAPAFVPYMNGEYIIRRDGNGFVTEIDGTLYRVLEVTPAETPINRLPGNAQRVNVPSGGILPTLTPEGEFAWVFGLVTVDTRQDVMEMTVLFESTVTGENHFRTVNLHRIAPTAPQPRYPVFAVHETGGLTVLENRSLLNLSPEEDNAFLRSGYELRDRPVLVMDLRGHIGGNIGHPRRWVGRFTGQGEPRHGSLFAGSNLQRSQVALELLDFFVPLHLSIPDQIRELLMRMDPRFVRTEYLGSPLPEHLRSRLTTSVPLTPPRASIPNENLVIILTDKNINSAGELFVGHLRQLENVLVVGTNTAGTFVTGGLGRTILPYSGLVITFGTLLNLRHDLSRFEGVGFMPDLWVPPGESLERVLRFIERHGLLQK